jgi:hypothetical protein
MEASDSVSYLTDILKEKLSLRGYSCQQLFSVVAGRRTALLKPAATSHVYPTWCTTPSPYNKMDSSKEPPAHHD